MSASVESRVELIDAEVRMLARIWQHPSTSLGQSSVIVGRTIELLARRERLLAGGEM